MATSEDRPFCCRCKEDFPVNKYDFWQMGKLNKLEQAPKRIRDQYREWLSSEVHGEGYLCGNCYFDLTDTDT